jgi:hypothetical protein
MSKRYRPNHSTAPHPAQSPAVQYTLERLEGLLHRILDHLERSIEDLATMWEDIRDRPEVKMSQKMSVHSNLVRRCVIVARLLKSWQKNAFVKSLPTAASHAPTLNATPPAATTGMDLGALLNPEALGIKGCLGKSDGHALLNRA